MEKLEKKTIKTKCGEITFEIKTGKKEAYLQVDYSHKDITSIPEGVYAYNFQDLLQYKAELDKFFRYLAKCPRADKPAYSELKVVYNDVFNEDEEEYNVF